MRLLFIASRLPLPADSGGQIRTFNLVRQAAKSHKVDFVSFSFDEQDARHALALRDLDVTITLVPAREPNVVRKCGTIMFGVLPYSVTKYRSAAMEQTIVNLMSANAYDLVHFEQVHVAHYQPLCAGRPCLLDQQNVEYRIVERCAESATSAVARRVFSAQARKMKSFETRQIARFSACSAVSDDDARALMNLTRGARPVYTLPNGVDTDFFDAQSTSVHGMPEQDAVVFTGSREWLPNADAVAYFCDDILPLIWAVKPHVKFYIVGKKSAGRTRVLADPRIVETGRVDDVRVFTARSKVFVVPLRIGGGTRLKILEAMSMGRAVVSTSIGAEGIDYTEDTHLYIADRPESFAAKVVSLLDDADRRSALGTAGRQLALGRYDWNCIGETLRSIYADVVRGQPAWSDAARAAGIPIARRNVASRSLGSPQAS